MKKIIVLVFMLFFSSTLIFTQQYYVCFASFTKKENAQYLKNKLNRENIPSFIKKSLITGQLFYRVIYQDSFSQYEKAQEQLRLLKNNSIIKSEKLNSLWILIDKKPETTQKKVHNKMAPNSNSKNNVEVVLTQAGEDLLAQAKPQISKQNEFTREATSDKEEGKIIFATQSIPINNKTNIKTKESFTFPQPVYARAFLPAPIGKVKAENFWHEIWINNKLVRRTYFRSPPEADWDQIQIWVSEDEYQDQIKNLKPGQHQLTLLVYINQFQGKKSITDTNEKGESVTTEKEIWIPRILAKGTFQYLVP
ncbi:MAG: SPOR domain-containing protein [Spirochaetes bacterium]|nr:SPOR domain-containing protein [Spirochaetota bacterium]